MEIGVMVVKFIKIYIAICTYAVLYHPLDRLINYFWPSRWADVIGALLLVLNIPISYAIAHYMVKVIKESD